MVEPVVTQVLGARYKVRPVSELVTQMGGEKSCQKLSSLNRFHFQNFQCLLIIVRSGPVLMLVLVGAFGVTNEMLAPKLDIADNQYCTSLSARVGKG
jgi:hypothetical protein